MSEGKFGSMVSVEADFTIKAVPFSELVDPQTLYTKIRLIDRQSDLYKLKEILSYSIRSNKNGFFGTYAKKKISPFI